MRFLLTYIYAILLLFNVSVGAQSNLRNSPEAPQSSIELDIEQAQTALDDAHYTNARDLLEIALTKGKKTGNQKSLGVIYASLGKLHLFIENPNEAKQYLDTATAMQTLVNDRINLAKTHKTYGQLHLFNKNHDLALSSFESAKKLCIETGLIKPYAETLLLEGKTYIVLKQYINAVVSLRQAVAISRQNNLLEINAAAVIQLAKAKHKLNRDKEALPLAVNGRDMAKANNYPHILTNAYMVLNDLYTSAENHKLASYYLNSYIKLSDSLKKAKNKVFTDSYKNQFLTSELTATAKAQQSDAERQKMENSFGKLTTILSIALITILSLLTLSLYKNNNIRRKTNHLLHKKNSELMMAKEKAELAFKTKTNFLSTVTHELRTPLYAVTGLTKILLDENPKPEQLKHLKSLQFSGEYLLTFINDILQINKIEANKVGVENEVFNLNDNIKNVISALNNSAQNNKVKVHFTYDKELPKSFNSDRLKISQILINLIGNAIKFTTDGDIWVRAYKLGEEEHNITKVRFEVEDTGIGIDKKKQDTLFESFSQGSIEINRKYGGTGLGLSIVKGLLDILDGKIYMKSEPGIGSTFYFEIPMKHSIKKAEAKDTVSDEVFKTLKLDNIKILVVEDNKINQMVTQNILNKMDLENDLAEDGETAVTMVKDNYYNVVLMDIHMPGISGLEATSIIRTFNKDITIFALTAVTLEDKMQEFNEAGFDAIISKPFRQEDFKKLLFNALNKNDNLTKDNKVTSKAS